MELTTGTGIYCGHCDLEIQVTTRGLLGGLLKQAAVSAAIDQLKARGGVVTCPTCGKKSVVRSSAIG